MATNYENAEQFREYYLTHKPRKNTVNICTGRRNWDVCDYGDVYGGAGCECWKQDGRHLCVKCHEQNRI